MTLWISIALIAYLLFAFNGIADKFLLTRAVKDPRVYVFYLGVASLLVFLLAPFGLHTISSGLLLVAIAAGVCFAFAQYYFYSAIQETSISRILPIEGGIIPLITLLLVFGTGLESFNNKTLIAFGFLVAGSVLMAFKKTKTGWHPQALKHGLLAALFFSLSFVLTKFVYEHTNFLSGLIWSKLGLGLSAGALLVSKSARDAIFRAPKTTTSGNKILFYTAHAASALGNFLQNYAIAIGSVVIVNALQGVQFVFILVMSIVLSKFFPKVLKEQISAPILVQKIFAIVLITIGLVLVNK